MLYLLTGSHGFIGSRVRQLLKGRGEYVLPADLKIGIDLSDRASFERIRSEVRSLGEDVVILHLADFVDARESLSNPKKYFGNNLALAYNVAQLGALENVNGVVFTSSAAVYGEPEYLPIDVSHPTRPKSPYGLAKLYEEQILQRFSEEYGYDLVILRLFNVYGENQEKGLFGALIRSLCEGKPFTVYGDGEQVRDYIYVGDVAETLISVAVSGRSRTYNVASGVGTSVNKILEWVRERFSLNARHADPISGEIRESVGKPDVRLPPITKERVWSVLEKNHMNHAGT